MSKGTTVRELISRPSRPCPRRPSPENRCACRVHLGGRSAHLVGANPDYDPTIERRERNVDYGTGVTKAEATVDAEKEIARNADPGWQGTICRFDITREGNR